VALLWALWLPAVASATKPDDPPVPVRLDSGWEIRDFDAQAPPSQPAPPAEGDPGQQAPTAPTIPGQEEPVDPGWRPAHVPGVFDTDAKPELFGGTVKQYRLRFRAPKSRGYRWALHFEQVRRRATVFLNGRKLGVRIDPYTPFQLPARGLKPGKLNELRVTVDSRKSPFLPEAWWNYGGINRPVTMVPIGRTTVRDLGLLSNVQCTGPATGCRAELLIDGRLSRLPRQRMTDRRPRRNTRTNRRKPPQPRLQVGLRSPTGKVTRQTFGLIGSPHQERRLALRMRVPKAQLWSPDVPDRYAATVKLLYDGRIEQITRQRIGLRSVDVKGGLLYLNNRPIQLRGASMHEDFIGNGAAMSGAAMDQTVRELKELGANTTRSHYVLSDALLRRLDRAGIMVWNQAPVWQRDSKSNLLSKSVGRSRAFAQLQRTVLAARSHPSVITHSIGNELSVVADKRFGTRRYIKYGAEQARRLDPTIPISLDVNGRPGYPRQRVYNGLDMLGINQYFGWYPWVKDFNALPAYLHQLRAQYPRKALVMTEFGAEARPDLADRPVVQKGSYGFQSQHLDRTLDVVEATPFMSGAIHWTLREFEIFPGWTGGVAAGPGRNTRHHKGVLTYEGQRKPAWSVLHDHFLRTPLYR